MKFQPIQLGRRPAAFSHPDWLYEIKFDGFRGLAHIEHGRCKLASYSFSDPFTSAQTFDLEQDSLVQLSQTFARYGGGT